MTVPHLPKELFRVGDDEFKIVWDDAKESRYLARDLRAQCPCAACADEWTGKRLIDPASVPQDLKFKDARLVGNYAIQFVFADGHSTGIFSFEYLRALSDRA